MPLEPEVDIFLPFWWIVKHAPQGAWNNSELHFNSPSCVKDCTEAATTAQFSLSLDPSIIGHPKAQIIGYVLATTTANPLNLVPKEFQQFLDIMGKEASDALPKHSSCDHEILLKEGEKPLWGPIYPLSEVELETLREYLKEMMRTGENLTINIKCWRPNPLRTKAVWPGPQTVCRLPRHQPNHCAQSIPAVTNIGTPGPNPRCAVLHQNGSEKQISSGPDEGRRGMKNSLSHLL